MFELFRHVDTRLPLGLRLRQQIRFLQLLRTRRAGYIRACVLALVREMPYEVLAVWYKTQQCSIMVVLTRPKTLLADSRGGSSRVAVRVLAPRCVLGHVEQSRDSRTKGEGLDQGKR